MGSLLTSCSRVLKIQHSKSRIRILVPTAKHGCRSNAPVHQIKNHKHRHSMSLIFRNSTAERTPEHFQDGQALNALLEVKFKTWLEPRHTYAPPTDVQRPPQASIPPTLLTDPTIIRACGSERESSSRNSVRIRGYSPQTSAAGATLRCDGDAFR
jgi:hypothetical protein